MNAESESQVEEGRKKREEGKLTLRKVASEADATAISRAARAAGHQTIMPTHIVTKELPPVDLLGEGVGIRRECVGYASLNAMPILTGWLDAEKVSDRDADAIVDQLSEEARLAGLQWLAMPVTEDCRFRHRMAQLGYRQVGRPLTLYLKVL